MNLISDLPVWTFVSWAWLLVLSFALWRIYSHLGCLSDKLDDYAKRQEIYHPADREDSIEQEVKRLKHGR